MSLQRPRRNHHQRPFAQTSTAHRGLTHCHPRHEGNRRIQSQRLFEKRLGERQLPRVLKAHRRIADHGGDLLAQPGEPVRLIRQDIKGPGQRTRGGLVASQKKDTQLINELLAGERFTGLLITRGDHATSDVIKRLGVIEVRINQGAQMSANPLAGCQYLRRLRDVAPGGLEDQTQHVDLHCGAFKQREVLEHIHRHAGLQRRREHGAANDVCREMTHGEIEGERFSGRGLFLKRQQVVVDGRLHRAKGVTDAHVREGGVNHRALAFPALAIGHKNTVADQMLQRTDHQVTFGEHALRVAHDFAHSLGFVEEYRRAPGVTQVADVKVVSSRRQEFKQIAVTFPQYAGEGDHRPPRQRLGWDIQLRCAHLTVPTRSPQYGGGI